MTTTYINETRLDNTAMNAAVNESEALTSFLKVVNGVIRGNDCQNPMSDKTAMKFLISRKFDIQRALELYQKHEIIRLREGLQQLDPYDEYLKSELFSGKFTILKQKDNNNRAIAIFTAKLHSPNKSFRDPIVGKRAHKYTLQGIVYQLDSALEDIITQRNGIVFIYNMNDSDYSNFDYELCQKILNLLKGAYPAKLKKVLIVSPPLWFRAPFHLLRLIVREKLQKRVELVSIDQLQNHLPPTALTRDLGGSVLHDHDSWIEECNALHRIQSNDLCDATSAQNLVDSMTQLSASGPNFRRPSLENPFGFSNNLDDELCEKISNSMIATSKSNENLANKANIYDYDETGVSLNLFLDLIRKKGCMGLGDEYESIVSSGTTGKFLVSTNPVNMRKNRYVNVVCYDHTRVVLEPYDLPDGVDSSDPMDYINASFVDGYRQLRGYISTQGPLDSTFMDFWRMIWQTGSKVIVMVTLNVENQVKKCDRYWPSADQRILTTGVYKVEYVGEDQQEDFIMTHLKLTNTRSDVTRDITHLQFISWPDFGVPETAAALLKFRECVLKKQLEAIEYTGNSNYPPIVVHCSAGIGRSGTFITLDISIQKLETTGLVDIKCVVEKLRAQRYSSIQTRNQYIFCYKAVIEYAASCGLLDGQRWDIL